MARTGTLRIEAHIAGPFGVPEVEVINVVRTRLKVVGDGSEENPHRSLTQYWSQDGELLATVDPAEAKDEETILAGLGSIGPVGRL